MKFRRLALFLLVVLTVVGCNNEKNRNLIDKRVDQAVRMGEEAQAPAPKKTFDPLRVTDKVWAGNVSVRLRSGVPLPPKYETARGATLILGAPASLNEVASMIGGQTGIPVRVVATQSAGGGASVNTPMPVAYEGPLSGLLDLIAGHYGMHWHYDGASVSFSRYTTRVFVVESLPGSQTIRDGIKEDSSSGEGNSSSSSSGAGGGSFSVSSTSSLMQSSEMTAEMKVWEELEGTIKAMLDGIGTVVVSPSSGTVTVTTTPDKLRTIAKFIEEENHRLAQQIAINVEIYSIGLQEGTDFSVQFGETLKKLSDSFNVDFGGVTSDAISGAGSVSVVVLNPKKMGQISTVFNALSTLGDTSRVAQFPMTTLNNRPISRRIGRDRTYIASSTYVPATATTAATTSIMPGTIREGFSLQLTPRMLEDGRIMLQYSLSLTDILNIRTFNSETGESTTASISGSTGSTTVQLPETSSRVFVQQSMLKSGSTLVLAGYDDEQVQQNSHGMGSPYNYFLGGGSSNTKSRAMLFIAITPQVLEVPRGDRDL